MNKLAVLSLVLVSPLAAMQSFTSGDTRTHLVELYTSQGCSSCPPADEYASELLKHGGLWSTWVPVVYHVDYWDYLGWKDSLGKRDFSQRQRQVAEDNTGRVYTPAFYIDGREWRGFFQQQPLPVTGRETAGTLKAETADGQRVKITYTPHSSDSDNLVAHVALLGFGLDYAIEAGENRGRTLRHDFATLDYQSVMLMRQGNTYTGEVVLEPGGTLEGKTRGVAAWVTPYGSFEPYQATGGFLHTASTAPAEAS